jgi:predicted RNA-binding protein
MPAKWLDQYNILDDSDQHSLEAAAAAHEFKGNLPREQAEAKAHRDYMRQHAIRAMAHHYMGGKIANMLNDQESIDKHGIAYESAAQNGGFDMGSVPPEVIEFARAGSQDLYKYKDHPSDAFFPVQCQKPQLPDNQKIIQIVEGLKRLQGLV